MSEVSKFSDLKKKEAAKLLYLFFRNNSCKNKCSVTVYEMNKSSCFSLTEDVAVNTLESAPLGLDGEACLEFWYLAPLPARAPQLRALLKSSTGLREIWTSPALPGGSWRQVFVQLNITEPGMKVKSKYIFITDIFVTKLHREVFFFLHLLKQ